MKKFIIFLIIVILIGVGVWYFTSQPVNNAPANGNNGGEENGEEQANISVTPISHATAELEWGGNRIYLDPVGGEEAFSDDPEPDLILLTHTHPDHFSTSTLAAIVEDEAQIIAPQTVYDQMPESLQGQTTVMDNGETLNLEGELSGVNIEAVPMYNLPESDDAYHVKGDGNGYVLTYEDRRVYVAGDTEDISEMRNLENIDIAFIPMNLPYTMTVEDAADGVLAFAPKTVHPYHYRGQDGFSDVERFKQLVASENDSIEVILRDWYSNEE